MKKMTAKEKAAADWRLVCFIRCTGEDRQWAEQRDANTGKRRFVSQSRGGKNVIRYGSIR